jgi:hypothetical protein
VRFVSSAGRSAGGFIPAKHWGVFPFPIAMRGALFQLRR